MLESFIPGMIKAIIRVTGALCITIGLMSSSNAAGPACGNTAAGFKSWLSSYKQTLQAQGISRTTINRALSGITYNPTVIKYDRNQKVFQTQLRRILQAPR